MLSAARQPSLARQLARVQGCSPENMQDPCLQPCATISSLHASCVLLLCVGVACGVLAHGEHSQQHFGMEDVQLECPILKMILIAFTSHILEKKYIWAHVFNPKPGRRKADPPKKNKCMFGLKL